MAGPFLSYAKPDAYTQTNFEAGVASLPSILRVPALVGVGAELLQVDDEELVRGSSPTADNFRPDEVIPSAQVLGTNRTFSVQNFPIVTGEGSGTITTDPNDVTVKVDGEKVPVAFVDGLAGTVTTSIPPELGSVVTVSYYFKLTDTQVENEDLSDQIDGARVLFKLDHSPIVDGTGAGRLSNSTDDLVVTLNGSPVTPESVDGAAGTFTLGTAPASGAMDVTYFFNQYDNTFEYLSKAGVSEIIRVGNTPGKANYFAPDDFTLVDGTIHWGATATELDITVPTGKDSLADKLIITLVASRVYREEVALSVDGVTSEFLLDFVPTEGTGSARTTDDPTFLTAYVGASPYAAVAAPILQVFGIEKTIILTTAPTSGSNVYVSYWRNELIDDIYTVTVTTEGIVGVGDYTIDSERFGALSSIVLATEPALKPTVFLNALRTAPGASPSETITVTFTSAVDFTVTSSLGGLGTQGTGSLLQSFVSTVTGVSFTLDDTSGPPYAALDVITFTVVQGDDFLTAAAPNRQIPGLLVVVPDTSNNGGVIAQITTYNKSGAEPNVGDIYYVSFKYEKQDYNPQLFTDFSDLVRYAGQLNLNNSLTLASYLAFLNGAPAVIVKQILRAPNSSDATSTDYIDALEDLKVPVSGVKPAIVLPLNTDPTVQAAYQKHVEIMSSIRYQSERITIFGCPANTGISSVKLLAEGFKSNRVWLVYPDTAVITIEDSQGNALEQIVDGSILAAAVAGVNTDLAFDAATPMTNKNVVGIRRLGRKLNLQEQDIVASSGVFLLEERGSNITIRDGLTTDMSSIFFRQTQITTAADVVQQVVRAALRPIIGRKVLPGILSIVKNRLSSALRSLKEAQIIFGFQSPKVLFGTEPDTVQCTVAYQPIFGLNYIVITFNLRTSI